MKDIEQNHRNNTKPDSNALVQSMDSSSDASTSTSGSASIESVSELIGQIYARTFKRNTIRKTEFKRMRENPVLNENEMNKLVEHASNDRLLKSTLKLITIGVKIESSNVSDQIENFVTKALEKHPAFRGPSLSGPEINVIRLIADPKRYRNLKWPDGNIELTVKQANECRDNALRCFLLWVWMTKNIPIERVHEYLLIYKWRPSVLPSISDAEKIILLASARNTETMAISTEIIDNDAVEQRQRTESAEEANEQLLEQLSLLKLKLDESLSALSGTQLKAESLKEQLEKEHQEYANYCAHLRDDYETLRGQVIRRLNDELTLLEEGLHALRRNPPKVDIMIDHAERAIEGLKNECNRIQKRGD